MRTRWPGVRYLYVIPAFIFFLGLIVYPIVDVVRISLTTHDVASRGHGLFANFSAVLHDPVFLTSLENVALFFVITQFFQLGMGGLLAYLIETYTKASKVFLRVAFFLPTVTSVSVIAIVWEQIYSNAAEGGPLQYYLGKIGIHYTFNPLADPHTVIYALMLVNIWEFTGFAMLLYVVALHNVPEELLDAARVDGASGWRLFRYVLIPLVSRITKSQILLGIIGTLQLFPLIYIMTGGGPDNASQVFGTYIFTKGFLDNETSYAAALSVITLIIALIGTLVQTRVFGGNFDLAGDGD